MSKNLFDFGNETINNSFAENNGNSGVNDFSNNKDNILNNKFVKNNVSEDEITKMYEKYKNYSSADLTQEFIATSKERLKEGNLTPEKINSTANALLPFLNDTQKEIMFKLLGKLND